MLAFSLALRMGAGITVAYIVDIVTREYLPVKAGAVGGLHNLGRHIDDPAAGFDAPSPRW